MKFGKSCAPSILFLIVNFIILALTIFSNFNIQMLIMKIIFLVIGYFLLNLLCSNKLTMLSWILVLFSFFMMFR